MHQNSTGIFSVCLFLVFWFAVYPIAQAQTQYPITGPATSNVNQTKNYSYWSDEYYFVTNPTWTITPGSAAQVISSGTLSDHFTATANIKWLEPGVHTLRINYGGDVIGTLTVTVACSTLPSAPTTAAIVIPVCGSSGAATLDAAPGTNGTGVRWYAAASGGSSLASTAQYTTPTISTATNYYVSSTSYNGFCESTSRYPVAVAVNPAVSAPTAKIDATRCDKGSITLTATPASPATSIRWYTSLAAGELLATGISHSPTLNNEGDTYFYAATYNTITGCTSEARLAVKGTIGSFPPALTQQGDVAAFGSASLVIRSIPIKQNKWSAESLSDTSVYQVRWYPSSTAAETNTGLLAKGIQYTTPVISTTTEYFMRLENKTTGCLGPVSKARATILPLVSKYSVKTETIRVPGKKTDADLLTLTDVQRSVSIIHLDGLGRVSQQVAIKASPDGKDIVQPVEYDALGRVTKQYLPYTDNTNEAFRQNFESAQSSFYQNEIKVAHDAYPYSRSVYENSPVGRITEQTSAGQAWQPGSGHTSKVIYGFNSGATASEAEEVRKFNPDGSSSGFYPANVLNRTESIDADGNKIITFISPAGQTLAVKQQVNNTQYLETYHIYDDFGRLKFTIQPEGVVALRTDGWNFKLSFRKQHVFQYVYDKWGRVIETRVPGKGWSYTVYDQLSRPVLTQDTLLKASNKWLFVKYDRSGRPVMTGLYTDNTNTTRSYFQTLLDNKNYQTEKHFETRNTSGTHKYTNDAFPTTGTEVHNVMYYDTYDFDSYATYTTASLVDEETQGPSAGKLTGSKTLVPGTATWLKKFVYYDGQGRVIQVRSNNHLNATPDNLNSTSYDFEKVLQTKTYHNSGTTGATTVLNTYEYYDQGRLKQVKQKNNSGTDQLVVRYEYNALGQVVDKKLHGTGSPGSEIFLQSVDYRYTINGQLASINNATLDASTSANDETTDYFGMELLYNATESNLSTTQRYSGMVSAIKWKGPGPTGSNGQRSYAFGYDKSGKLENAAYAVKDGSAWNKEAGAQDEAMSYDRNGNILTLQRKQRKYDDLTAAYVNETIDNLAYAYKTTDKNNLEKVTDAAGSAAASGFNNGSSSTSNDYTYDANGNLLSDANKGITSIVYNFLGKPTQVNFSDGKKIEYVYDAGGNKLTQKLYQGTTLLTTTDYVNGFVYENGTLSFFGSPEGRVVNTSGTLTYEYSIADHQGNTRVVFGTTATPVTVTANFESSTNSDFPNYANVVRSPLPLFNKTASGTYSQKLTGASGSQVGIAKSMKVYPGDKVKIEAYGKYYNPTSTTSNISGFALALTGAFGVTSSSTGEALKAYNTLNNYGGIIAGGGSGGSNSYPKLFVNILLFDKDYNFLDAAWEQIDGGEQIGTTPTNHDLMSKEVTVKEAGFAYVFVSNENPTLVEFYVDDVVITHTPTNVIQYNEYYPFGLQTSTSWTRDNTKDNNYLYNAANELNKTSGWYEMFYRGYDPAIGRMLQVDPYAPMYASHTTYNYAVNNPVMVNDPSGGQVQAPPGVSEIGWRRYNLINNPDNYMSDWSDSFTNYVAQHDFMTLGKGGNLTYTNDPAVIAQILAAFGARVGALGSKEWMAGSIMTVGGVTYSYLGVNNVSGFKIVRTPVRESNGNLNGAYVVVGSAETVYDNSKNMDPSFWDRFQVEGDISIGLQLGLNLNKAVQLEGNILSTGAGFSVGRENSFYHPMMYPPGKGIPIKQSWGAGALGITYSHERSMVAMWGGADNLTDKSLETIPIIPLLLSHFTETITDSSGKKTVQNGYMIGASASLIIGAGFSIKFFTD